MFLQTPAPTDAAAQVAGNSNAEAMKQMGFANLAQGFDWLGWVVFITLVVMSFLSWYFIIANTIRNGLVKSRADGVINGFWNNPSTQDAIRELEGQPKGEPFSKIALEAASAVAHHQQANKGGLAESLSRSEFVDRALRQAVARPVGEALIMTAIGLFTAIPALLAFNFFNRSNRVIFARFDEFAHDLHDFFATGSRVE